MLIRGGILLLAIGCDGGGGGGGGAPEGGATAAAVAGTGAGATGGPILTYARLDDADRSGGASAGDAIVLGFDQEIDASGLTAASVRLLSPADSLGAGATVSPQSRPFEAAVLLGAGAALTLYDSYVPGRGAAPRSPAAVSVDPGAVRGLDGRAGRWGRPAPIVLPRAERARFQPDPSRGALSLYRGQMHAHTSYSDGAGFPADAYDMARGNGLDWFAVTDHLEFYVVQTWRWPYTRSQADARTIDGSFVALRGYEWGHGVYNPILGQMVNHANVLSDRVMSVPDTATLDAFYSELADLGDDPIGKFNHPGKAPQSQFGVTLTWNDWDDFRYTPAADRFMRLVKTIGTSYDDARGYLQLLDRGWHVAPAFGEDNHSATWGTSPNRMAVYATALTRDGIEEGLRAMRTFTSSDRDAWVRLVARDPAGDLWMGSTVSGPGPIAFEIEAGDPTDPLDKLEIVTFGGSVATAVALSGSHGASVEWTADPSEDAFYYARVTEADGDLIYSAPIFVDR